MNKIKSVPPTAFKLTATTKKLLKELCKFMQLSKTQVITILIEKAYLKKEQVITSYINSEQEEQK